MQATFALLANNEIHNLVRKLSWDIHQKFRTGIEVTRLYPHISLKQPFDISDIHSLEKYMTEFARSIDPFDVLLTELQLVEATIDGLDTGILWLDVQETETLRQLHDRLNQELTSRFGNVPATFDGPDYHFHMTVAIGNQPVETYRQIKNEFFGRLRNLPFQIQELVMFVYDDPDAINPGFMTYMILPVSKKSFQSIRST